MGTVHPLPYESRPGKQFPSHNRQGVVIGTRNHGVPVNAD